MSRPKMRFKVAYQRYKDNKKRCTNMGHIWELSFDEWYNWWLAQGVDKNAPGVAYSKNSLVMVRIDETQTYNINNIQAMTRGVSASGHKCRSLGKERPETWVIKDRELRKRYVPFLRARAQANFRGEEWAMTFEEFCEKWGEFWELRGRGSLDYSMTRSDPDGQWSMDNTEVLTRREQLQRASQYRVATGKVKGWRKNK